jgi:plasmid stability protein
VISCDIIRCSRYHSARHHHRNLPEPVHTALRLIAAERHISVEALARAALTDLAAQARPGGIDFRKLAHDREALGLSHDGPEWTDALDHPTFSRRVLGLDKA